MNKINLHLLWLGWAVFIIVVGCLETTSLALASNQPSTQSDLEEKRPDIVEIWLLDKPEKMVGATWDPRVMGEFGMGLFFVEKPHLLIIHLPNGKDIKIHSIQTSFSIDDWIVSSIRVAHPKGFDLTFDEAVKFARKFLAYFHVPLRSNMHNRIKFLEKQVHAGEKFLPFHFGVDLDLYPGLVSFIRIAQSVDGSWYVIYRFSTKLRDKEKNS